MTGSWAGFYFGMPFEGKMLAQIQPAPATWTPAYAVPASLSANIYKVWVCNVANANSHYSIRIIPAGATPEPKHLIKNEATLAGKADIDFNLEITLHVGDALQVLCDNGNCAFNITGVEGNIQL